MSQAVTTTTQAAPVGLQCVTGRFNLLFFIQAQIFPPPAGDVIGQIQPLTGGPPIPVIQTQAINIPLSQIDNQIVTLCGVFVVRAGQVVLDVRFVLRVFPFPPRQIDPRTLLLLLLLRGFPFGKFGKGFGKDFGKGGLGKLGGLGGLGPGGLGGLGGLGPGGLGGLGTTGTPTGF